jgi:ribA/ribD-fused uncharacterized protein
MAAGFVLIVNGILILTSEALYQALRFPDFPDLQKRIIEAKSPMTAKMITKSHRETKTRKDWDEVRVKLMRWCIRAKLLQNWKSFNLVLSETGDLPIVEKSTKGDIFWGAIEVKAGEPLKNQRIKVRPEYFESPEMPAGHLAGYNVMGRLLQELRENVKKGTDQMTNDFSCLDPFPIENFLLYGKPIEKIERR